MASKALNGVFQRIRALASVHTSRACSDRQLLERFLVAEDEAAFTLLVERHGPMIQGLCRRLLRDRHEADDACQATFLVLARKARSLRKQESLASWLHGIAYRISLSLRRQHARRLKREQAVGKSEVCEPDDNLSWQEFRAVLDDELQRLPQRYRAPLILCYLEGKTRDEAALQLGAKPGALHGLLDRGRKMLRDRLIKRGITLSAVLFATALSETTSKAALAPTLVIASARAALAFLRGEAIGEGLIAANVLTLVKEASTTMFMTKLKIGAALVVAASILTSVVGGSLSSVSLAQDKAAAQPKATPAAPQKKGESDEKFIRRMSKDLRGVEPTSTEVHFFVKNQDANRRQKLIDLFIQERQAKERAQVQRQETIVLTQDVRSFKQAIWVDLGHPLTSHIDASCAKCHTQPVLGNRLFASSPRRLSTLHWELVKDLSTTAKDKKEVAAITQKYLDQLQEYVKADPKNDDAADAMRQIELIYRSQGKTVEADAWRDKLRKEYPQSPAANTSQQTSSATRQAWIEWFHAGATTSNPPCPVINRAILNANPPHAAVFWNLDNQANVPKKDEKKDKQQ